MLCSVICQVLLDALHPAGGAALKAAQQHRADHTDGVCRFHYTMMAWLPTFFSDTLSLSLTQAAQVRSSAALPFWLITYDFNVAGDCWDYLPSRRSNAQNCVWVIVGCCRAEIAGCMFAKIYVQHSLAVAWLCA